MIVIHALPWEDLVFTPYFVFCAFFVGFVLGAMLGILSAEESE